MLFIVKNRLTCERFCVFWSAACWGGNRGVPGTAIPYEKLGNTEIRRNTDTAFMIGRFLYVFATSSMYAPENNLRHYEKTWEDLGQFNDWKAQSIPLSLKSLTFIKLFSLLWFLLHIVLTRSIRQESANALNGIPLATPWRIFSYRIPLTKRMKRRIPQSG